MITKNLTLNDGLMSLISYYCAFLNTLPYLLTLIWCYCLTHCHLWNNGWSVSYIIVFIWCTCEIIFYSFRCYRWYKINQSPSLQNPTSTVQERCETLNAFIEGESKEAVANWLKMDADRWKPNHQLQKSDVLNFFSWSIHYKYFNELSFEYQNQIKKLSKHPKFQINSNEQQPSNIRCFTSFKLPFQYMPIIIYSMVYLIQRMTPILAILQFHFYSIDQIPNLGYWIRQPGHQFNEEPPIVFCHGLGIGLIQYISFIYQLVQKYPERTIILLQLDYISMKLVHNPPSRADHVQLIDHIFMTHDISAATWIGHSFGTFILSYVAQLRTNYIHSLILIDPVNLKLYQSNFTNNLLFQRSETIFHQVIRQLIIYEYSNINLIFKHFYWNEMILLPRHLAQFQGSIKFYLSECDCLIDCNEISDYINKEFKLGKCELTVLSNAFHGEGVVNVKLMNIILKGL